MRLIAEEMEASSSSVDPKDYASGIFQSIGSSLSLPSPPTLLLFLWSPKSSFVSPILTSYSHLPRSTTGYKEFSALPTTSLTPSSLPTKPFQAALTQMKLATRQYAKSQVRWITVKLRGVVKERTVEGKEGMFLLDASGESTSFDLFSLRSFSA